MNCKSCGAALEDDAHFCTECGAPVRIVCPSCGADNPAAAKFCKQCGNHFAAPASAVAPTPPAPAATYAAPTTASEHPPGVVGERRHLTVLFSDLANSTHIASQLDPEDWEEMAADYQREAGDAMRRFGGYVAKFLGDGVLALFGWPEAHEDDAERAVRAGLAVIDAMQLINAKFSARGLPALSVRVGIHTGPVVIGTGGGDAADVFGDTPNVAARVQSEAEPNTLFITHAVQALVAGRFIVEERGAHQMKGVAQPMDLYRVVQANVAHGGFRISAGGEVTPLIGRDHELQFLCSRWERVRDGEGQFITIIGEPGIGKSRLIEEFRARIGSEPHLSMQCAGEALFQNTAFYAITQTLKRGFLWRGDESYEEQAKTLDLSMQLAGMDLEETVPIVARMLGMAVPPKYSPVVIPPDQERKQLLSALIAWVFGVSRLQPLVIVLEALHWVDPSTMELVQLLAEQGATVPLMMMVTSRPDFRPPWPPRVHHAQITLSRLTAADERRMIAAMPESAAVPQEVVDTIVERASGIPFYIEELTRLVQEGGGRSTEIPATLQDSLMARLDRLGPAREIAQISAVIGREFSYEVLRAVSGLPDGILQEMLRKLVDAEIIYARGIPPAATYQFRHALMHDAAYEALLKSRRRELHMTVARALREKVPQIASAHPELVAVHLAEAGATDEASLLWQRAAGQAVERGALKEAEQHTRKAIAALATLAESPARAARELQLQVELMSQIIGARGMLSSDATQPFARIHELSKSVEDPVPALLPMWLVKSNAAETEAAKVLSDEMLALAYNRDDPGYRCWAHCTQTLSCHQLGDFAGVEEHLRLTLESYDEALHSGVAEDPKLIALAAASNAALVSGRPDTALARALEALALAERANRPWDILNVRTALWRVYDLRGEAELARQDAQALFDLATQYQMPNFVGLGEFCLGHADAIENHSSAGIATMREGLAEFVAAGLRSLIPSSLALLAEVQSNSGDAEGAIATVEDGLQASQSLKVFVPELLRVRAEARLKMAAQAGENLTLAKADLKEAIALSQAMGAKLFELFAATTLARIYKERGEKRAARDLLAPVYASFAEGLETPAVRAVKAFLDELSSS
ncbi:MAG: adenylate/guanylate cyclase domain-containing protein [Candidatus Binataceae bacterium]